MSPEAPEPVTTWLSALRASQHRLAGLVAPMDNAAVRSPSYAREWSIAQVLSHLGSGAEIFTMFLEAGLAGVPAPGMERFQPVWQEWNAKSPAAQARDGVRADADFVDRLEGVAADQRARWRLEMFGSERSLVDVIRMRLGEHTLHTWDVAVSLDPAATLQPEGVELLVDHLAELVARAGKSPEQPVEVAITTDDPHRDFGLHAGDGQVALTSAPAGAPTADRATLRAPAEALIRLVYGRLDPDHTPPLHAEGVDLDQLRQMFPGV